MEIWKDVKGYEGAYQVSNLGRVKSFKLNNERILKYGTNPGGYPYVNLCLKGKVKSKSVHRLVAETFIDNPENKPQVNHKSGIKNDNRVINLEWNTKSENEKHAFRIGLKCLKGENHNQSKLTELDVLKIRELYKDKKNTYKNVGEMFNVSGSCIQHIVTKRSWT
jgi:hypothetical protein